MATDKDRLRKLLKRSAKFRAKIEKAFSKHEDRATEYDRVSDLLAQVESELEKLGQRKKTAKPARKKKR